MIIQRVTDYEKIRDIYGKSFSHEFDPADALIEAEIVDGETVLAYGYIKLFAEAIMISNQNEPAIKRAEAIKMLLHHGIESARIAKLKELHAFAIDEKFTDLLINHFGFQRIKGSALALEL